eukprot:355422_1
MAMSHSKSYYYILCIFGVCYLYVLYHVTPTTRSTSTTMLHERNKSINNTTYTRQQQDVLYVFLNGGVRNEDFLSPTLLHLDEHSKDYLVFSDDINYHNKDWNNTHRSRHIRVPTKHIKHLLEYPSLKTKDDNKLPKNLIINYMWTQALEYLIDHKGMRTYKAFIINEDDIQICNQSLLDEFALQFINDGAMNVLHLWDTCRGSSKYSHRKIVKTWGKFHLFKKHYCGGVSTMIKPQILEQVLKCLYQGEQKEQALDGPHGRYRSGLGDVRRKPRDAVGFTLFCNQTVYDAHAAHK